jgi:hypothetical protein
MTRIALEIGTLHLEGLRVPGYLAEEFGRAVEAQLSDLMRTRGLPATLRGGRVLLSNPAIQVPANLPARKAPAYVAEGLYHSLGGRR